MTNAQSNIPEGEELVIRPKYRQPGDDIAVTPEMIKAGADIVQWKGWNSDFETAEKFAARVFGAMAAASEYHSRQENQVASL